MVIRRAKTSELSALRDFYNTHWGSKHALINVKAFVDFYFVNGEYLNFIIARDTEDTEIISACGYVLSNATDNPDVWTTLWLTKKGAGSNVGLQIVNYMATEMGFRILSTNNARRNTLVLYEFLGYSTAKMDHYYRLSDRASYKVAIPKHCEILPYETTRYTLRRFHTPQALMDTFDASNLLHKKPYKDMDYIIKRFYHFPYFNYSVFGIMDEQNHCRSIIVFRKVDVNYTSVLRIVDLIGHYPDIAKIGHCIHELLNDLACEYVEFCCFGIAPEIMAKAGFSKHDDHDGHIIPTYLEPYAPINTAYYFFSNDIKDFVMCKADGDQDRLNIEIL